MENENTTAQHINRQPSHKDQQEHNEKIIMIINHNHLLLRSVTFASGSEVMTQQMLAMLLPVKTVSG